MVNNLIDAVGDNVRALFEQPERVHELDVKGIGEKRTETMVESLRKWELDKAAEKLSDHDIGVLSRADESYPEALAEIYDPPPALFYRGDPSVLEGTAVAIVGTRSASEHGKEVAESIARGLAEIDITVVSGLAAGIDGAAHRGALNADGPTAAVLGTGVDRTYPSRHRDLQTAVANEGVVMSEYPPGTEPKQAHFPERNRIVSGLSRATIVVQAGARSGALITADFALEQGREVYAVPGHVDEDNHRGCHMLIKQGAGLVESAEDVIDYLQIEGVFSAPGQSITLSEREAQLFERIKHQPVTIDQLVNETGISTGECSELLLELENKNLVVGLPGQRYQQSHDARHVDVMVEEGEE